MIPRSWIMIGAGVALLGSNAITGCVVRDYYVTQAEAERARAKSDALEAARRIEAAQAAETARRDAETRDRDAAHAKEIAAIAAAADASSADYGKRLRVLQNRVNSCRASAETAYSSEPARDSTGSDAGLSEGIGRDIAALGEAANKLAATVRSCVAWAKEVGR